jgi:predicted DNA-binding ribbon-helix-helix protein
MKRSPIVKRSITVAGRNTSVSIESPFWDALGEIARQRRTSLSRLVTSIDLRREHYNLSSAIRLFVFDCHRRPEPEPATVLLKAPIQRRLIS